ncbi:MAG: SAM-dependent methyltransferase [Micavibrio sp.]|nr:SAM-dependent methyltransferase [Micavibrio sp.]|tara:strand:+ start:3821 stop:6484 length:2664 start_codon:yes stop_codon:yes gene_type:complete
MNIAQIEKNLSELVKNISPQEFVYDLLLAYGTPKTTVTLLKKGNRNLSKKGGQIILKRKLFFQETQEQDLHSLIDSLKNDDATHRHDPRFIVVTDYKTLLAIDTKTDDTLDIKIEELNKHPFFFGPWAKIEKNTHYNEQEADVKAAEKMAKIYDEILQGNAFETKEDLHGLNIFLSRLLFCFFAEDTGIFKDNAFTNAISSHTQEDGSDLDDYLNKLFEVLNTADHSNYPDYLSKFPYVNGGLFGDRYFAPKFSRKARRMIIECGELDWATINPDIFGSMFQAVVHKDQRSSMGQHYTSVPNIMKVIEPLFLNELREEFDKHYDNQKKLEQLLARLEKLRIFDPACGSGNFLIIAYKEIRELEMEIFQRIQEITDNPSLPFSRIQLSQFYGIELDDFAHEVAILSLWLAEHQMNVKFEEVFGQTNPTLPLKEGGNIVCGNATRIPWEDVCPKDTDAEIYVLGNPPYAGQKNHTDDHRGDLDYVFTGQPNYKKLDYISCWFYLAARYINNSIRSGFVTTNSICQGTQVDMLWPKILSQDVEICFCYSAFKWSNNAKHNAGVTCTIIGLMHKSCNYQKRIYDNGTISTVQNINPYLVSGPNLIISKQSKPISKFFPKMILGNQPREGGYLMLTSDEAKSLRHQNPRVDSYLKRLFGANEFINSIERWCIWITEKELNDALNIPEIAERVEKVRLKRVDGNSVERSFANVPYRFVTIKQPKEYQFLIPIVSSENREYIPVGFLDKNNIVTSKASVIFDCPIFIFGLIASKSHMLWVKAVSGRLGTGISYSAEMCYNTFPVPDLTEKQKETITTHVYNVLEEREKHSEKTMAELYDPDKMPDGLREAHHHLDLAVERCYRSKPFTSDEERLEYLFKLYEDMTAKEKSGGLL